MRTLIPQFSTVLMGALALAVLVISLVLLIVYFGFAPLRADTPAPALEASLAMKALHAVAEREMGSVADPLPENVANFSAGLDVYKNRCILCHGASDGKSSSLAAGFYIPAPQFASDGAEDDPEGATFWKIRHGIRFSAMPSFGRSLSEEQIWQVTMLLRHLDELPGPVRAQWKALPSVGEPGGEMSGGPMRR